MTLDEPRLREAWRERTPAAVEPAGCPEADRIWSAVALEIDAPQRRSVVAHVATCATCAETFRLAAGLAAPERHAVSRPRRLPLGVGALLAASLSILTLGSYLWLRDTGLEPVRSGTAVAIQSLLDEGAELPRERFLLRWSPGPEGTIYDVVVGTAELKLLSRATALTETAYLVPEESFDGITAGTSIAWRVEATLPDGRTLASVTHFNTVR